MECCNLLNMSELNTGGGNFPLLCLWVTKRLARCVPSGRFFYAQCTIPIHIELKTKINIK